MGKHFYVHMCASLDQGHMLALSTCLHVCRSGCNVGTFGKANANAHMRTSSKCSHMSMQMHMFTCAQLWTSSNISIVQNMDTCQHIFMWSYIRISQVGHMLKHMRMFTHTCIQEHSHELVHRCTYMKLILVQFLTIVICQYTWTYAHVCSS